MYTIILYVYCTITLAHLYIYILYICIVYMLYIVDSTYGPHFQVYTVSNDNTEPTVFTGVPASMYYTFVTLTTVGYGDLVRVLWV